MWYVYILRCADGTLYTGVTTDVTARVAVHNGEIKGSEAKYTKARRPVELVYTEQTTDRSAAQRREWEIKQLTREGKEALMRNGQQA